MPKSLLRLIAGLAFAMAPLCAAPQAAAAAAQADGASESTFTQEEFVSAQNYFFENGRFWRQDNRSHSAGDGSPAAWIQTYDWGPGRSSVIVRTDALSDDGSCDLLFIGIRRLDPQTGLIDIYQVGAGGVLGTGQTARATLDTTRSEVGVTLPDGTIIRMRDTTSYDDPARFNIRAEAWDAEAEQWQPRDEVEWRRLENSPCA